MLHQGKTALVTGGASGIGRAAALAFAREGAKVAVADLKAEEGAAVAAAIRADGGEAIFIRTDVTSEADVQKMIRTTVDTFGRLDSAFNNAGFNGIAGTVASISEADWHRMMDINATSVYLCMKYEVPEMIARGGGAIVNTSSGMGLFALPKVAGYIASKHAVIGLTKSAAIDFGPQGVRVNALLPGKTLTEMTRTSYELLRLNLNDVAATLPLRRLGRPEDQAEAAVWLCSDRASFITGLSMIVDGGEAAER
jgi:NAD(P)-dependent dehydrogenase (short-subunit alcohol dehydrogenase family)